MAEYSPLRNSLFLGIFAENIFVLFSVPISGVLRTTLFGLFVPLSGHPDNSIFSDIFFIVENVVVSIPIEVAGYEMFLEKGEYSNLCAELPV